MTLGRPGWVLPGASVDMNFATGQYFGLTPGQLTVSRASTEYEVCNGQLTTFPPNVLAITPGCGAWVWEQRTNLFLNNNAPATQTITVASGSVYTVSFYGTGTLTLAGAATQVMTGSAFPALTQYSFVAATTSLVATVTVLGAMQYPQVELNPNATTAPQGFATGPILTSAGAVTRAATTANSPALAAIVAGKSGTIMADAQIFAPVGNSIPLIFLADDGTINNRREVFPNVGNMAQVIFNNVGSGSTYQNYSNLGGSFSTASRRSVVTWTPSTQYTTFDGSTPVSSASAPAAVGINQFYIGSSNLSSAPLNGFIKEIAIWPYAVANPQQLSTAGYR